MCACDFATTVQSWRFLLNLKIMALIFHIFIHQLSRWVTDRELQGQGVCISDVPKPALRIAFLDAVYFR